MPRKDGPDSCCISGNTGSKKYVYINVQKAAFQRTLRKTTWEMDRNNVAIWMTAPFQYLLITGKVVALQEVCFSDTKNPKAACWHIETQWQGLCA